MLVILVLVTGMPVVMGMSGMTACADCGPAIVVGGAFCIVAFLAAGFALLLVALVQALARRNQAVPLTLPPFLLERPPRLA